MKGKKALPLFLFTLVFALFISGCSSSESGGSNDGEKTIKFMHLWPEGSSPDHNRIINDVIADYEEKNTDVKIELEVLSNEQYKDKLKVLSASDQLPDVGLTWPGGFLESYVEGNKFASLDEVFDDELKNSFVAGSTDAYSVDGKQYGLPIELNTTLIYYNKKMFDEYGLKVPETYEEFTDVIKTLRENNIDPIALGNKDRWTGSLWYMYLADRLGNTEDLRNAINGEASFESPSIITAAEKIQNMVDMGAFSKGFNGLSEEEAKSMFRNEQAAMYLMGTWDLSSYTISDMLLEEFKESVGYFKFPTVNGEGNRDSFVGGPGTGLFVAENSDVKEEATDFVKYFIENWGDRSVEEAGVIPATKVDTEKIDLPKMYIDVLNDLNNASNLTLFADVQMSPEAAEVHLNAIQALYGEEISPEEFAKMHEEALSKE